MRVTVAMCTWNRAALLDQSLAGLHGLKVPAGMEWRLVVVNNNCTDNTDLVIARHARDLPLTRLHESTPGLSHARNCALDNTAGDWILWTDDDVLVDPEWLVAFAATVDRHPDATGVGGTVIPWFPFEPDPDLMEAFPPIRRGFCGLDHGDVERPLAHGEDIFGANMAFHRGRTSGLRFDPQRGRVKGFLGGEDDLNFVDAVRGTGGSVIWSPAMRVKHYVDPERMTTAYMDRWYADLGEFSVRRDGLPPGTRWFGVPRWIMRRYVAALAELARARVSRQRADYLKARRKYRFILGTVRGCRAVAESSD